MSEPTEDPTCRIVARGDADGVPYVVYASAAGEEWVIRGTCAACGACETPGDPQRIWTGIPVGQPGACLDPRFGTRRDVPVRPEIRADCPPCSLSGEYRRRAG